MPPPPPTGTETAQYMVPHCRHQVGHRRSRRRRCSIHRPRLRLHPATTTRFVQLAPPFVGARTTTVEPTMPPPPALARATDSDYQLLAPRDRDSCAHLTAASADAVAASTARRPHSVYVDANDDV